MEKQTEEIKLSVIIPVYNIEKKYLYRCVQSVINQDVNMEVILIDDGSDNGCRQLCDALSYEHANLMTIHQKNSGVSNARNKGLSYASGKYITFVDADDWVEDGMYREMLLSAEQNDLDIVISGFIRDYDGVIKYRFDFNEKIILTCEETLYELLKREKFGWGPCDKIFKKRTISNILFDSNYAMGEDLDFVWHCVKKSKRIFYMPLYKYHYCFRNDSATAEINPIKKNNSVLVMKNILMDCEKNFPELIDNIKGLLIKEMSSMIMQAYVENTCKIQVEEYQRYIRDNYIFLMRAKNLSASMKCGIFLLSCNYMLGGCLINIWKLIMKK